MDHRFGHQHVVHCCSLWHDLGTSLKADVLRACAAKFCLFKIRSALVLFWKWHPSWFISGCPRKVRRRIRRQRRPLPHRQQLQWCPTRPLQRLRLPLRRSQLSCLLSVPESGLHSHWVSLFIAQPRLVNPFAADVLDPPQEQRMVAWGGGAAAAFGGPPEPKSRGPAKKPYPSSGGDKRDKAQKYSTSYKTFGHFPEPWLASYIAKLNVASATSMPAVSTLRTNTLPSGSTICQRAATPSCASTSAADNSCWQCCSWPQG